VARSALAEYEKFIVDKTRDDEKKLCIEAYEEILTDHR
jgi:hypothetical protein